MSTSVILCLSPFLVQWEDIGIVLCRQKGCRTEVPPRFTSYGSATDNVTGRVETEGIEVVSTRACAVRLREAPSHNEPARLMHSVRCCFVYTFPTVIVCQLRCKYEDLDRCCRVSLRRWL